MGSIFLGIAPTAVAIVTGYKNQNNDIKVQCSRCQVVMVRRFKSRKHDTIDLFAPEGAGKAVSVMESRLAKFVKERNEALFSLDRSTIESYLKRRGMGVPENDIVFWAAVYKSIYNITDAPAELKEKAITWLQAHGMRGEVTCYCPR